MGIRFKCHHCQAALNIKSELAQKRGVCPQCHGKFRIPRQSQEWSLSLDAVTQATSPSATRQPGGGSGIFVRDAKPAIDKESTISTAGSETTIDEPLAEPLYFVRPPSGGEYGPAAKETIELWISQRRITSETLVCVIGSSQWKKAGEVFASYFVLD